MLPTCVAALAALLATAPGAPEDDARVALVGPPPVMDLVVEALPPPPATVVRETRTYGKITIEHAKHLARRASCARCHDPGPVTKIVFTPQIAHQRCVGCHKEVAAGPTHCTGCHVKTAPPTAVAAAEPETAESDTKAAAAEKTSTAGPVAKSAGAAVAGDPLSGTRAMRRASRHVLELGFAAGPGVGPSLRISSMRDGLLRSYSIERLSGGASARILTLLGVGLARPVFSSGTAFAAGVAGFDAQESPGLGFAPAIGGRVGLEWMPPRRWFVRSVHLSLTGVSDIASGGYGETGGVRFYLTLASGLGRRE